MDYSEAIEYMERVSSLGSRPGLERVTELLRRLGAPQDALKYVHVAGTNGKGSVCALVSSALTASGYKTGLFTSPHLRRMNERFKIDGEDISDGNFAALISHVARAAEGMAEPCTEFELAAAAGFYYFARERCDIVVLEVGMGGRLDATNVISAPDCAVITNIGLDHTAYLGDTEAKIAAEKAGIIKGGPVVSYAQEKPVADVLAGICEERGSSLTFADFDAIVPISNSLAGQSFAYRGEKYEISLLGEHQQKNAAVALEALSVLRERGFDLPRESVRQGLKAARWPARFEIVSEKPTVVVDGGHNPQCVETTAAALRSYFPGRRIIFLMGVLRDKDRDAMLDTLCPLAESFVCVTPPSARALPAEELCEEIQKRGVPAVSSAAVPDGVSRAMALAGEDGVVCCVGSLYTTGEIRACFGLN